MPVSYSSEVDKTAVLKLRENVHNFINTKYVISFSLYFSGFSRISICFIIYIGKCMKLAYVITIMS